MYPVGFSTSLCCVTVEEGLAFLLFNTVDRFPRDVLREDVLKYRKAIK